MDGACGVCKRGSTVPGRPCLWGQYCAGEGDDGRRRLHIGTRGVLELLRSYLELCTFANFLGIKMNGKTLTVNHGYPVRAIFPGILGARSVKWLNRIHVQKQESMNHYQQRDYKILPPAAVDAEAAEKYWESTPPMHDMPINSVIGVPSSGSTVKVDESGTIEVRGYAVPAGMDGPVTKVEVSGNGGETWVEAELDFGGREKAGLDTGEDRQSVRWAWCLWKAKVRVEKGKEKRVVSKTTDWKGNVQPKEAAWTLRGVGYNAWGEADNLTIV